MKLSDIIFQAIELVPEVKAHLSDKALKVLKSIDTYDRQLWKYALDLYRGGDPGVFITDFVNAISNQLTRAWNAGAKEMGVMPADMTDDDRSEIQAIINAEYEHILDLGTAITAAQPGTIQEFRDTFRSRIDLWINRYTDVVNQAKIYFGGKTRLIWVEGDTLEKCPTCLALNGIVAFAQEWEQSGVRPQSPPNNAIECGGWNCSCTLQVTDKRRSPLALQRIMDIATSANIGGKSYNPSQPRVPAGDSEGGQWVSQGLSINGGIDPIIKNDVENAYNKSINALPEIKDIFNGVDTTELNIREPIQFDEFTHKIKIDKFIANHPIEYNSGNREVQDKMVQKSGEEVFIHEFGHVANRTVYEKIKQSYPNEQDFEEYANKYQNAIKALRANSEHLSWYADFRETEWIAERFNYEVTRGGEPLLINLMRETIANL
jgi:hypothetical protein